jgi:hypothetical protein
VSSRDAPPVLEVVVQSLDEITPVLILGVVWREVLTIAPGRDDGLNVGPC